MRVEGLGVEGLRDTSGCTQNCCLDPSTHVRGLYLVFRSSLITWFAASGEPAILAGSALGGVCLRQLPVRS